MLSTWVLKTHRDQDSPTSTIVATFPSSYVLQIKSQGETLESREGQGDSLESKCLKAYCEFHGGQLRETEIVSQSRGDMKRGKKGA